MGPPCGRLSEARYYNSGSLLSKPSFQVINITRRLGEKQLMDPASESTEFEVNEKHPGGIASLFRLMAGLNTANGA